MSTRGFEFAARCLRVRLRSLVVDIHRTAWTKQSSVCINGRTYEHCILIREELNCIESSDPWSSFEKVFRLNP
jgi:hypothetical protein